jgi:mono/diheme cytochrome c family protein
MVYGRFCGSCHRIDGEGVDQAPDLTHAGAERDAQWLRDWIANPEEIDPLSDMPPFYDRLTGDELTAIANYLAARN